MLAYADYLIVITPPDALAKEMERYKRASVNLVGHFEGMYSKAQIVVSHQTRCKPYMAQPAFEQMAKRLSTMPPIQLRLDGFAYFSHPKNIKTIYAAIENTDETGRWFRLLEQQMRIKLKGFVPHIAIAKNIPATVFNKLWTHFENRELQQTFTTGSLTVLHRDTYVEYCEWRVYRELFFGNRLREMF